MHHNLKSILKSFDVPWTLPAFAPSFGPHQSAVEIRVNDRGFKVGDTVTLHEFDTDAQGFTGRKIHGRIWFVTWPGFPAIPADHVLFYYQETGRDKSGPTLNFDEGEPA